MAAEGASSQAARVDAGGRDFGDGSREVLGAAFAVLNGLGPGFLEKVYENALAIELVERGLKVQQQAALEVRYRGRAVGTYVADLIVGGRLLVELKCVRELDRVHEAQCINYLKGSGLTTCLLLNFSRPRLAFRRLVLRQEEPRMDANGREYPTQAK